MSQPSEKELYFAARNRAMERVVEGRELINQAVPFFAEGIVCAEEIEFNKSMKEVVRIIHPEDNFSFAFICGLLMKLEAVKGKSYEASWMKRGNQSVVSNIQRKYDIIEARLTSGKNLGENLPTNLADLAVYCIKEIARQAELEPDKFVEWVEEIRSLE